MTDSVAVIVNPIKVADSDTLRSAIRERAIAARLPDPAWFETTKDDPGRGMLEKAVAGGATLILVCGGDGTVAACCGALADLESPAVSIAVIPAGTGNLLARNLDLPLDRDKALDVAFGSGRRAVDVCAAGDRRFVVMAGLGFDAALIRDTDENLKSRIGWLAYLGGFAKAFRRSERARFTVSVDGKPAVSHWGIGVLVGNVGSVQGGLAVLPDATPDDGVADVIVLKPGSVGDHLALLWRLIRRKPDEGTQAEIIRGSRVEVSCDRPLPIEFDGEFDGPATSLSVSVMPGAITLCHPARHH